ncbi:serine/threonine-protein kinase PknL [Abditibacteriota bacterium]|nr:serine/threonine-protein kinase PknL [Abditibacteriota bacterium]
MITCPTCGAQNPPGATTCSSCGTALQNLGVPTNASNSVALPRDTQLRSGNYIVGPVLGQGGFGITYKAGDMNLRRFVAIKEFFPFGAGRNRGTVQPTGGMTQSSYEETKKKFLEEARTLARFNHPAIVRVYSVWEENNSAYMAMEFLEGKTLQKLVEEKGSIPEKAAVAHIKAVAEALDSVHAAGLIHRDIKPDNICVTDDGRTVLIDFGTARSFAAGKTVKQTAMLTPGYAPLEQYGQQARFGAFSDVYALGATLYHCLTGRMPAPATDRISGVEVQPPDQINPSISPGVSRAVMHSMQIKAADRPQTMKEFVAELETPAVPARPVPPPLPAQAATPLVGTPGAAQPAYVPPPQSVPPVGGGYTATRTGDGQIFTNAPPQIALSALWRGFSTFGVNNPTIDFAGGRVLGSTPMDLRSYGQNITGLVFQDPNGTLISIRSESGMPLNLTDFGRSRGEQRGLTEHVEQALLGAPPSGYLPGGMAVGSAPGQSYMPPPVAPIAPVSNPYGGPVYNPYGPGYGQQLPARRGGEVITYALLALFCCQLLAPIAWIRGNAALAEYGDLDPGDRGTVQAGRIIGIILTVLLGLWLILMLIGGLSSN